MIKNVKYNHIEIFKVFNDIKICDSSLIQLNDSLRDTYKGFSEDKSASEMKIQTVYSFKSKQLETFEFEDGTTNDNSYMKTLVYKINTNELLTEKLIMSNWQELIT